MIFLKAGETIGIDVPQGATAPTYQVKEGVWTIYTAAATAITVVLPCSGGTFTSAGAVDVIMEPGVGLISPGDAALAVHRPESYANLLSRNAFEVGGGPELGTRNSAAVLNVLNASRSTSGR